MSHTIVKDHKEMEELIQLLPIMDPNVTQITIALYPESAEHIARLAIALENNPHVWRFRIKSTAHESTISKASVDSLVQLLTKNKTLQYVSLDCFFPHIYRYHPHYPNYSAPTLESMQRTYGIAFGEMLMKNTTLRSFAVIDKNFGYQASAHLNLCRNRGNYSLTQFIVLSTDPTEDVPFCLKTPNWAWGLHRAMNKRNQAILILEETLNILLTKKDWVDPLREAIKTDALSELILDYLAFEKREVPLLKLSIEEIKALYLNAIARVKQLYGLPEVPKAKARVNSNRTIYWEKKSIAEQWINILENPITLIPEPEIGTSFKEKINHAVSAKLEMRSELGGSSEIARKRAAIHASVTHASSVAARSEREVKYLKAQENRTRIQKARQEAAKARAKNPQRMINSVPACLPKQLTPLESIIQKQSKALLKLLTQLKTRTDHLAHRALEKVDSTFSLPDLAREAREKFAHIDRHLPILQNYTRNDFRWILPPKIVTKQYNAGLIGRLMEVYVPHVEEIHFTADLSSHYAPSRPDVPLCGKAPFASDSNHALPATVLSFSSSAASAMSAAGSLSTSDVSVSAVESDGKKVSSLGNR